MDEFFKKGLYQTPLARGKHALQPRFRNIQINCIPCSWRLERTGRKVNSSPPPCLGAGKAEISPNYSESPTEFSYIWLHKHVNTYYLTAFSSICSSLHSSTRLFPNTASLKGLCRFAVFKTGTAAALCSSPSCHKPYQEPANTASHIPGAQIPPGSTKCIQQQKLPRSITEHRK